MSESDDWVSISALQHYSFCERQAVLMYVDGVWRDNVFTVGGQHVHQRRVDRPGYERRKDRRYYRRMRLIHRELRLTGYADWVSRCLDEDAPPEWMPHEVKSGSYSTYIADAVQLTAQALCIEEMTGQPVPSGEIWYAKSRRARAIEFTDGLRRETLATLAGFRARLRDRHLPAVTVHAGLCADCSLRGVCQPRAVRSDTKEYTQWLFDCDAP